MTQEEYAKLVHEKLLSLVRATGSQHKVAQMMGVSDTTISLFLKTGDVNKYPVVWKWLSKNYDVPSRPPVDPRPRRWMRTDNMRAALQIFLETYPEAELYLRVNGAYLLLDAETVRNA